MSKELRTHYQPNLIRLPKAIFPSKVNIEDLEKYWDFKFLEDYDEFTLLAKVPLGWLLRQTNYIDRYDLFDPAGNKRAHVSIESRPHDTGNPLTDEILQSYRRNSRVDTRMTVYSRFFIMRERRKAEPNYGATFALDRKTGKTVFIAGYCSTNKFSDLQILELAVKDWLFEHYSDNLNPFAYWDQP